MRTTTKRKMPGENRKLNMLETKRRATTKNKNNKLEKKIQEKHSVDRNENHIACQTMANTCSREGRGLGTGRECWKTLPLCWASSYRINWVLYVPAEIALLLLKWNTLHIVLVKQMNILAPSPRLPLALSLSPFLLEIHTNFKIYRYI